MRASSGYARVATIRPLCCAAAHPPPPPPLPLPPQHNHTTTNTPHFIRSIAHSTPPNHPCLPLRYSTAMPQQLLHKRSRAATVGPASSKRARSSQLSPTATLSLSPIQLSDEGLDQPEPADELSTTSDSSHHSSSSSSSSTPPPAHAAQAWRCPLISLTGRNRSRCCPAVQRRRVQEQPIPHLP